jgi:glyoxylate reductase
VAEERWRVLVTRRLPAPAMERIAERCDITLHEGQWAMPRDRLLEDIVGKVGAVTLLTDRVDDEFLDAAGEQLVIVANYAVGFDNIDVEACTRRGIPAGNTPGVLTETTADLAFALLMAAARRIDEGSRYVRADRWRTWGPLLLLGVDVHGATLGIIGFGRIGQELAKRAAGFGMRVLYHDVHPAAPEVEHELGATRVELDRLLAESDFVSVHVNLTDETRHLIGADALRRMKPTAVLVNTSRGPVVDQAALYLALRDGRILAAALDVTDPEPMRGDDPLLSLENCLVVPHIASASRVTRGKMAAMAAANLLAGIAGERLPNPINPQVYG